MAHRCEHGLHLLGGGSNVVRLCRVQVERVRRVVFDEQPTRKSLTSDDQQRLIDEALSEIDFSQLEGSRS